MNQLMRYLGIVVIILGAVILAMYHFGIFESNAALVTAALCMVFGAIGHVVLNKIFED